MHTSSIHKNAMLDWTLIKMTVARSVDTVSFLTRYSNDHTK